LGKKTKPAISTSLESARRLAVTKHHLAGKLPARATRENILSMVRDLCYVQWDPIDVVAPSHIISLWSRLGTFRLSDLEGLLWEERRLFEHGNPLSLVLTEDYPIFSSMMRRYPESISDSWGTWKRSARMFLDGRRELRKRVLKELDRGPLQLGQFQDHVEKGRSADGWTPASDVAKMLYHLQMTGEVMIVGHRGNQNMYGLSEEFLPAWVERKELTEEEFEREAAQRALRALGIASPREIHIYFPRARYLHLDRTLEGLESESKIHRVQVTGLAGPKKLYIHDQDVKLLESVNTDAWQPRMALLAPFDNLTCLTGRTDRLFGFHYIHEQFLPANKRKYGTWVYPILWGDRLIGRADLRADKTRGKLMVNSVHAEPGAPSDKEVATRIGETMEELAEFVGMKEVEYTARVPRAWKNSLS
jgi:uncharacterized protein